jgi:hypothetical protein
MAATVEPTAIIIAKTFSMRCSGSQLSHNGKSASCPVANDEAVAASYTKLLQNVVDVIFDGPSA